MPARPALGWRPSPIRVHPRRHRGCSPRGGPISVASRSSPPSTFRVIEGLTPGLGPSTWCRGSPWPAGQWPMDRSRRPSRPATALPAGLANRSSCPASCTARNGPSRRSVGRRGAHFGPTRGLPLRIPPPAPPPSGPGPSWWRTTSGWRSRIWNWPGSSGAAMRSPQVRVLALRVGDAVQVSCNLIDPWTFGPEAAFDAVASRADVARAELVGLAPAAVLASVPPHRWKELDLDPSSTIEARLEQAGLDGGRFGSHGA